MKRSTAVRTAGSTSSIKIAPMFVSPNENKLSYRTESVASTGIVLII